MDQQLLAKTFVELADNLVADFDLMDFLRLLTDRCVGMLDASAAGVLLADRDGKLRVMAASDEQVRLLELFQLQNDEGPCLESFHTGAPVIIHDLTREIDQASGMLTVQLGVGIEEAFVRLRAHAYAQGRRLADVAADVVARRLRFPPDAEPDQAGEDD